MTMIILPSKNRVGLTTVMITAGFLLLPVLVTGCMVEDSPPSPDIPAPAIEKTIDETVPELDADYIIDYENGTIALGSLPVGARVADPAWQWEFRRGANYSDMSWLGGPAPPGEVRPVTWIVVAKDHYDGIGPHVTVLSEKLIGNYTFDNSTDRGHEREEYGHNHWGDSGTTNATLSLRCWLNSTEIHKGEGFYEAFSDRFKSAVIASELPNRDWVTGKDYSTTDRVFVPSATELGFTTRTYPDLIGQIGTAFEYFRGSEKAKIAKRDTVLGDAFVSYWTRSPQADCGRSVTIVAHNGIYGTGGASFGGNAVRPALNLKPETMVSPITEIEEFALIPTKNGADITEDWNGLIIVYEEEGHLMIVRGNDSPRSLTNGVGDSEPQIYPDGSKVLFKRYNADWQMHELWLVNRDGSGERPVVTQVMLHEIAGLSGDIPTDFYESFRLEPWEISYIESSGKVAFNTMLIFFHYHSVQNDLWLLDPKSGDIEMVLSSYDGGKFAFSPDGKRLMIADMASVSIMDGDTGNRQELLSFESFNAGYERAFIPHPSWSIDGSYAFVAIPDPDPMGSSGEAPFGKESYTKIWRFSRAGEAKQLSVIYWPDIDDIESGIIVSPDGHYVVHHSLEIDGRKSHISSTEGKVVKNIPFLYNVFGWSGDGSLVILESDEFFVAGPLNVPQALQLPVEDGYNSVFKKLKWVGPSTYVATLLLDPDDGLAPGMSAENLLMVSDVNGGLRVITSGVSSIDSFDAIMID